MDIISFNEAATANSRILKTNNDPDSTSGIVTTPSAIEDGESVTVPEGRVATLPNIQVDGELTVDGEVFVPSGATTSAIDAELALKTDKSGSVLQVVSTTFSSQGSTTITTDDTSSNPEIGMDIVPKGTDSSFLIKIRWFGEVDNAWNTVAHIHRDGSRINEADTVNYHGLSMATQTWGGDEDNVSTPEILTLETLDKTGSAVGTSITYTLRFSANEDRTMWTNRCFDAPENGHETGISEIMIMEIGA